LKKIKKLNVNLFLSDLPDEYFSLLESNYLGAELYISGENLDEFLLSRVEEIGETFCRKDIFVTVHGPFEDLNPGFRDSLLRETVVRRFLYAIDFAKALGSVSLVLHSGSVPGLSEKRYEKWFSNSIRTWEKVLSYAIEKDIIIALENIFDDSPGTLRRILDYFSSPYLQHCFDIGHYNLFVKETTVDEWLETFKDKLLEVHIHDNHGKRDEHLELGKGNINWLSFFNSLSKFPNYPILTIENHSLESIKSTVSYLRENSLF
jgi:sugar phosphate isomerase/epimerase